jgi:CheY-like chemotaxis protein
MLREAMRAARQGDRRQARSLLAEYTQENANDPLGWLWRAGVAHTPDLALLWLDQLLERHPEHEAGKRAHKLVRLQAGVVAARNGDRAMARIRFLEATKSDPTDVFAWLELAHHARSPSEQRTALEAAVRLQPDHEPARQALAELTESISEANADADRLIEIFDSNAPESAPLSVINRELSPLESRALSGLTRPPNLTKFDYPSPDMRMPEYERPVTPAPLAPPVPRGKSTPVLGQRSPAQHATVLVVDQDAERRQTLRAELEKRNIRGLTAAGASQAVVALRDLGVPDLILIDVDLAEIDGLQLCRYLRKSPDLARTPIVLTAGRIGLVLRLRAFFAGANGATPRSMPIATLESLLARHCPLPKPSEAAP